MTLVAGILGWSASLAILYLAVRWASVRTFSVQSLKI